MKIQEELQLLNVRTDSGLWLSVGLDESQAEAVAHVIKFYADKAFDKGCVVATRILALDKAEIPQIEKENFFKEYGML